jgi:hypothetical protein
MLRTEVIVGLTWESERLMGMRARMPTMQVSRKKHRNPMMDQPRKWRTMGMVLEIVKIAQYISNV